MSKNTILSLSINGTDTPYPFDSLELINKEHNIKAIISPFSGTIRVKFQRGFHPQEITASFHFASKKCVKESVCLKAETDEFILEVPESDTPLVEVELKIGKTYDHFNRLVIYEVEAF